MVYSPKTEDVLIDDFVCVLIDDFVCRVCQLVQVLQSLKSHVISHSSRNCGR